MSRLGVVVPHLPKDTKVSYLHNLSLQLASILILYCKDTEKVLLSIEGNKDMNHHAKSHPSERFRVQKYLELRKKHFRA